MLSLEPKRCQKTHVCVKVQLYSKVDSIHVQALRRSMSIKGFPKRLKTGNRGGGTLGSHDKNIQSQKIGPPGLLLAVEDNGALGLLLVKVLPAVETWVITYA